MIYNIPTFDQVRERISQPVVGAENPFFNDLAQYLYKYPFSIFPGEIVTVGDGVPFSWLTDGMPYYGLWLAPPGERAPTSSIEGVLDHLLAQRLGILFMTPDKVPFWKLNHSHVLSWKMFGVPNPDRFFNAPVDEDGSMITQSDERIQCGYPNEQMFPPMVRDCVRYVMKEHLGIAEPRVGCLQRESQPGVTRLIFDLDPVLLGGDERVAEAYRLICWHVPYCIPTIHLGGFSGASWMGTF